MILPVLTAPLPPVEEAVCEATEALRGVSERVRGLPDAELVAVTARVEELGRVVDALRARAAGEVADRSRHGAGDPLSGRYGCRTGTELLERVTGASVSTVRSRVRADERVRPRRTLTGEELPPVFPFLAVASEAGSVGVDAGEEIARAVTAARSGGGDPARVEAMEEYLVALAAGVIDADVETFPTTAEQWPSGMVRTAPVGVVRTHAQAWVEILTADGVEPDHDRVVTRRGITVTECPDGGFRLQGTLVPEAGALLQALLSAHTNPARSVCFAAVPGSVGDVADSGAGFTPAPAGGLVDGVDADEHGPDVPWGPDEIVHDPRTATQKRHDALFAMLHAASRAAETPTLGGSAPTVMIHVTAADLAAADGPTGGGVAHLDGVTQGVPVSVARRIGCTGDIMRIVFDRPGRVLDLSSLQRGFTPTQRKALIARDGGCVIPGCAIPAGWCEIHHVIEHARGGPTTTSNGVLLCWWHHHHLEHSGWGITMRDGAPHIAAPAWIDHRRIPRPAPTSQTRLRTRLRRRLE